MFKFMPDRRHAGHKHSRSSFSSRISLASGSTSTSLGSNASNSTITPDSTARRRTRTSSTHSLKSSAKNRTSSRSSSQIRDQPPARRLSKDSTDPTPTSEGPGDPSTDVFQFLNDDWDSRAPSRVSLVESIEHDPDEEETDPNPSASTVHGDPERNNNNEASERKGDGVQDDAPRSIHSDSGIFLRDDTPDRSPSATGPGSVISEVIAEDLSLLDSPRRTSSSAEPGLDSIVSMEDAESFYRTGSWLPGLQQPTSPDNSAQLYDLSRRSTNDLSPTDSMVPTSPSASNPTARPKTLYRKFERLNHRVLDSLQEEIMQLEAALDRLDSKNSMESVHSPDRRSFSWPTPSGSQAELPVAQIQRHELLNQIRIRLDQYNRALYSFQQMRQSFAPPGPLADEPSLLSRGLAHATGYNDPRQASAIQTACFLSLMATTLPFLVFRMLPSFFARLAMLLVLVGSVTFTVSSSQAAQKYINDHRPMVYLLAYSVLIMIAAVLVT